MGARKLHKLHWKFFAPVAFICLHAWVHVGPKMVRGIQKIVHGNILHLHFHEFIGMVSDNLLHMYFHELSLHEHDLQIAMALLCSAGESYTVPGLCTPTIFIIEM